MTNFSQKLNYKLKITALTALVFGITLLFFAYKIGPALDEYPVTYIICLSGCMLGWLIGIVTAPYDKDDENKLMKFSKLIGTFLTIPDVTEPLIQIQTEPLLLGFFSLTFRQIFSHVIGK